MNKLISFVFAILLALPAMGQNDKKPFRAYIYNKEYEVYLRIDFYDESITVPGQELYGQLPGYLGKMHNSFCWVITSATVVDNEAKIAMINGDNKTPGTNETVNSSDIHGKVVGVSKELGGFVHFVQSSTILLVMIIVILIVMVSVVWDIIKIRRNEGQ